MPTPPTRTRRATSPAHSSRSARRDGSGRRRRLTAVAVAVLVVPLLGVLLVTPGSNDDGGQNDEPAEADIDSAEAARTVGTSPPVELPFDPEERTSYAYAFTYSPGDLTAKVGDLVVFENADDVAHTFTDDQGRFDSGSVEPGEKYGFAYSQPGTYTFHCELHPTMRAQVRIDPLPEG